jgi:cell division protein FtsW (lipid II flippase)
MKIAFVLVLARYLRFRQNYRRLWGLLPPFALMLVPIALILKQPDLGTALVFVPALFAMLYIAGARMKHVLAIIGLGVALSPIAWFAGTDLPGFRHLPTLVKEYQRQRVYAMFQDDPATLQRTGYQQHYALTAFGSGGISGKGLGNIPVGNRVPEAHNDMIFALIGEQFGFFGAMIVIVAYIVLFAAGIEIASNTKEFPEPRGGDETHARYRRNPAVHQLWRIEPAGQLHGRRPAAQRRPESPAGDGPRGV